MNEAPVSERTPWRLGASELLLIFAFWTFVATLSSVNRILDPRGFGFRLSSPAAPVALELIESWIWAAVTPLIFWLSDRFMIERSNWIRRLPLLLVIGFGIAISLNLVLEIVRLQIIPRPPRFGFSPLRDIMRLRWVNQLLVYLAILAAGVARNFYKRDQLRQRHAAHLEAQLAVARLDALRMQLNPHFLFNTLHAVSALVERDPAGVRKMIARLSDLLRYITESRGSDEVPLSEELGFLQRYIDIMEIRFQGQLLVERKIDDDVLDALVPNLILQPIVENALEHGASRASGAGRVMIRGRRDGDRVALTVQDNGPGLPSEPRRGVGLQNTAARLEQLYGDAASLDVVAARDGGVIATIVVPYHTARDLRIPTV